MRPSPAKGDPTAIPTGSAASRSTPRSDRSARAGAPTALLRTRAAVGVRLRSLPWWMLGEWSLIVLLAAWFGRDLVNLDPTIWPLGGDFPLTIQPHYIWTHLTRCGSCVLWNGLINGGYPAFAEAHAGLLHPLVVISTLIWGVVNGAKLALVASFAMAGLAQWWLARVMGLGRVARLWTAGIAVLGGHLAGRMEMGLVAVVLSTAAGALIFAPMLQLGETGSRRSAVLLGIAIALVLLSGQGYIQAGIVPALAAGALVFGFDHHLRLRPVWKNVALAGGIGLLTAGIFLVPLLHFLPHASKHMDTGYLGGQPLAYVPLNLVVRDYSLYVSDTLGKITFPSMYISYIGWLPIGLALIPFRTHTAASRRRLLYLGLSTFLVFLFSSGTFVEWASHYLPDAMAYFRYPSLLAGLAVTPILGLAGWGVEEVLKVKWPQLVVDIAPAVSLRLGLLKPLVVLAMLWALKSPFDFGRTILKTTDPPIEAADMVSVLRSQEARWVAPEVSHYWMPALLEAGVKVTRVFRPVNWKDRQPPAPAIEYVGRIDAVGDIDPVIVAGQLAFVPRPENLYASVQSSIGPIPCRAQAELGNILVECTSEADGVLVVQENAWPGWNAVMDGQRIELQDGTWLQVRAPAGTHRYTFRYRPMDVVLGALLTLTGLGLAMWAWATSPRTAA